ncbi:MAG: hypothetical protein AB1746_08280, partial [Candidatus Zixiibacteriota bacterium]
MAYYLSIAGTTESVAVHLFNDKCFHFGSLGCQGIHLREATLDNITSFLWNMVVDLCEKYKIDTSELQSQCELISFAVSGIDHRFDPGYLLGILRCIGFRKIDDSSLIVNGIAEAIFRAVLKDDPGVLIRSGAGCSVFSSNKKGDKMLATAYSTPFGDRGSLSRLGKDILAVITDYMNGIATDDEEKVAISALKARSYSDPLRFYEDMQIKRIGQGHFVVLQDISQMAHILFDLARDGNRLAKDLLDGTREHLQALAVHQIKMLGLVEKSFNVLFHGSLFDKHGEMAESIFAGIRAQFPNANLKSKPKP